MLKINLKLATSCAASLLMCACGGGDGDTPARTAPGETTQASTPAADEAAAARGAAVPYQNYTAVPAGSFSDDFNALDATRWRVSNWSVGGYFLNAWHPGQLSFQAGRLVLKLQADVAGVSGKSAVSGEYTTVNAYKYGVYKARLKVPKTPGTIAGFFTYTGPVEGTQHDEIDVEIKGDDPTWMQVNYWYNNVEHPTLLKLDFDASAGEHEYAFRWSNRSIQWYVDDKLIHEEDGRRGPLPVTPGKIILNHWGTVGTMPWSTDYVVSTTPSVMTVDRVSFTPEPARPDVLVAVGAMSARAYYNTKAWRAQVSVTVRNVDGVVAPGVLVTGGFSVGGTPLSCTTDNSGACSITSARLDLLTKSTTFSVSKLSAAGTIHSASMDARTSLAVARP